MKFRAKWGLLVAGMFMAVPAQASDKKDFSECDGRVHPGRQEDGMRGEASRASHAVPIAFSANVAEACTRALASPRLLSTQTLRRAHLLRARAAAYLGAGDTSKALFDLDMAETAAAGLVGDRFYQRSMGASLKLLRAIALARSGDMASAVPLAHAAMEARPYSLQVQQTASAILQAARPIGTPSPSPWLSMIRLEPDAAMMALISEAAVGNSAGVLAFRPAVSVTWPTATVQQVSLLFARSAESSQMLSAVNVSLHTAYARAATGDAAGARRDVAEVRAKIAATRALPSAAKGQVLEMLSAANAALDRYIDGRAGQIEARIAVAEGRHEDAISALIAGPMLRDGVTLELLTALKATVPEKQAAMVPDLAPLRDELSQKQLALLGKIASDVLIAPETPRAVVDYEQARPDILGALLSGALTMGTSLLGGVSRTDGFRSTPNPDGTMKVEFIGNTPSASLVQEMTLLRAAEITRAAGKPDFVIVDRKDFSRRLATSQYGREISSVPMGFKTDLTIRFADANTEGGRAFNAVAIIDALGPFYYEGKRAE